MTNNALQTYLQDHLAGALHAIELLKAMRAHFTGQPFGAFASDMLLEVEADRDILVRLAESVGATSGGMKEFGAWLAEKVSRLKLKHGSSEGLGTFEALEFLLLGIHGKWALWRALAAIASFDSRLEGTDFAELIARAESQHEKVEEQRLDYVETVFRLGAPNASAVRG